jgi:hypothetical protein
MVLSVVVIDKNKKKTKLTSKLKSKRTGFDSARWIRNDWLGLPKTNLV